jgi:NADPH:quinone reductase-like Zn-dependent oxidoreductase
MKQIEFLAPGDPETVVLYADAETPPAVGAGEVLVRILAFPINPADLLTMQGIYPRLDSSTSAIGNEAVGEISAVGEAVTGLAPGDRVLLLSLNNWREYRLVKASEAIKISGRGEVMQQSGLKVNPATASLLLRHFVRLKEGDWMIQNAANSAVGRAVIQLTRIQGIKTINVVRRPDVVDELRALGGDVVLPDGGDLAERVAAATQNAPILLGIDCIGGLATDRLSSCLGPGATLVVYGAMSGEPATIAPGTIVFKDICIRGFWLTKYLLNAPREAIDALYRELDEFCTGGRLITKIDSVFRADNIKSAVRRASQTGIDGKVIVSFN